MVSLRITTPTLFLIILIIHLIRQVHSNDNWHIAYEWKEIDFKYDTIEKRSAAIKHNEFKPENVIPFGIEVYQSRLFVTLPRWRNGVPASLAYINLNDTSTKSPLLIPYPSWEAHSLNETNPELISPFRIRADRCGRLWVLDSRISSILENTELYGPAQLLIYDLHNDNLFRRHIFPSDHVKENSFYANLAIEDGDCDNTFAYAGDFGSPGLVIYSWKHDESWRIQHNFFHPDPLAGNYSIAGRNFQLDDGLYGLALSKIHPDGYSTLYFHPLSSIMEFAVNTKILRNKTLATKGPIYKEFKILGSRGPNGQAGASFLDQLSGVLFYSVLNLNAVHCWETSSEEYSIKSQGRIYMNSTEMVFPSDIKVDDHERLWVLSNNLQEFLYGSLFPNSVNFRVFTARVKDAIENTACDIKMKSVLGNVHRIGDIENNISNKTENSNKSNKVSSAAPQVVLARLLALTTATIYLRISIF